VRWAAAAAAVALGAACPSVIGCRPERADAVELERIAALAWTLPPGGSPDGSGTALHRTPEGAEAKWQISGPMTWVEYRRWSEARAAGPYRRTRSDGSGLTFLRLTTGDAFVVEVTVLASGAPVRLLVTFSARPD
jgi:hypothetical protein